MDRNGDKMNGSSEGIRVEAGTHLLADFWGVSPLDATALERAVRTAVDAAGATLLELALHQFPGHGGVTGYALLAESHLGVHTWPERDYVAIDVFMCGAQHPERALEVLRRAFRPARETIRAVRRGERVGATGNARDEGMRTDGIAFVADAEVRGPTTDRETPFVEGTNRHARRASDASSTGSAP